MFAKDVPPGADLPKTETVDEVQLTAACAAGVKLCGDADNQNTADREGREAWALACRF